MDKRDRIMGIIFGSFYMVFSTIILIMMIVKLVQIL